MISKIQAMMLVASIICFGVSVDAYATRTEYTGTVAYMRVHDLSAEGADKSWFTLNGFTSFGTCGLSNGGVLLKIKDDENGKRHFAMLTAAHIAGKRVRVGVDDVRKDNNGYCILWYLDYLP